MRLQFEWDYTRMSVFLRLVKHPMAEEIWDTDTLGVCLCLRVINNGKTAGYFWFHKPTNERVELLGCNKDAIEINACLPNHRLQKGLIETLWMVGGLLDAETVVIQNRDMPWVKRLGFIEIADGVYEAPLRVKTCHSSSPSS